MKHWKVALCLISAIAIIGLFFTTKNSDLENASTKQLVSSAPKANKIDEGFGTYLHSLQEENSSPQELATLFKAYRETKLSEQSIQDFHASSDNPFKLKQAQVAHILFATRPDMSLAERKAQYDRAIVVYVQAKNGTDFGELAKQYSDDIASAKKAGHLGWINKGVISEEFSQLVFEQLQPGKVSKPLQTRFGIHLVRLLAEPRFQKTPIEDARPFIKSYIEGKLHEEWLQVSSLAAAN